jgi:L-seryl-tRNA(Ser) seleniumtransferase
MGAGHDTDAEQLRALPAVHELAARLDAPHALAVQAARIAIDEHRSALLAGQPGESVVAVEDRALRALRNLQQPSLRRVLNATGVIVHTNLGRAPLPKAAQAAVAATAGGYSNLEFDLAGGERASRHDHVDQLLRELTGAEAAMVVNNGAGAVLLAAAALAGGGKPMIVSRGQLVEIGGGFRIPEVVAQSGSTLIEVGTTNRTRLDDYRRALTGEATILRVHPSNFRTVGFVEEVAIEQLTSLGAPVIDDVGSGVLARAAGIAELGAEPSIRRSIDAGAATVCCSGDKLLGGPQAGLLVGTSAAIAAAKRHPLARALRIDKLSLAALEATLLLYRDPQRARAEIPVLAMLEQPEAALQRRAERIAARIGAGATVERATAKIGGGALPLLELEGPVVALQGDHPQELAAALRRHDPPVIARISQGMVLLDPRTLSDEEADVAAEAAAAALG